MKVKRNIIFNKAGGTAGKSSLTYKLNIPADMVKGLGITSESRGVTLEFDGEKILIKKAVD